MDSERDVYKTRRGKLAKISLFIIVAALTSRSPLVDAFLPSSGHQLHSNQRLSWTQQQNIPAISLSLSAKSGKKKKKPTDSTITVNRIAYRNYEIVDTYEAGVSLLGTEVKSIRDGKHSMAGEYFQHEERRVRPLLLHKTQARKLKQQTEQTGMTIVPLKAYFNENNIVKLQIALCRGKNVRDKRQDIKEREAKRDDNRIIKSFRV